MIEENNMKKSASILIIVLLVGMMFVGMFGVTDLFIGEAAAADGSFGGGNGTAGDPYQIRTVDQLQNMSANLSANYTIKQDIDAGSTSGWNDGSGFNPIGSEAAPFRGSLDGGGYDIILMYVQRQDRPTGLFGWIGASGTVDDVMIQQAQIAGGDSTGALAGVNKGTITSSYSSGTISGWNMVGGLVGNNNGGTITGSDSICAVSGNFDAGGLVGTNTDSASITTSRAQAVVVGIETVGGVVGSNDNSTISQCYSLPDVTGTENTGGLVGENRNLAVISESMVKRHANDKVFGALNTGGFAGFVDNADISDSFAWPDVAGDDNTGGFIGLMESGSATRCYSIGASTGDFATLGGLVGAQTAGSVTSSYWNQDTSGLLGSAGGTPLFDNFAKQQVSYGGWNFPGIWTIREDEFYPYLSWDYSSKENFVSPDTLYVLEDEPFTLNLGVQGLDNDMLTWSVDMPFSPWLSFDNAAGSFSGNLAQDDVGTYTAIIHVADGYADPPEPVYYGPFVEKMLEQDTYGWEFPPLTRYENDGNTGYEAGEYVFVDSNNDWTIDPTEPCIYPLRDSDVWGGAVPAGYEYQTTDGVAFPNNVLFQNDDGDFIYETGEGIWHDAIVNGLFDNGETIWYNPPGNPLNGGEVGAAWNTWYTWPKFIESDGNNQLNRKSDEIAWQDIDNDDMYDQGEPVILGTYDLNPAGTFPAATWTGTPAFYNGDMDNPGYRDYRFDLDDPIWNNNVGDGLPWPQVRYDKPEDGDSRIIRIVVLNVNDAPVMTNTAPVTVTEDDRYSFVLEAVDTDPTADVLTWNMTTNAAWLELDGDHLHGVPGNGDVGTYWVNLSVDDGLVGGGDRSSFILTVQNVNDPPVIDPVVPPTGMEGQNFMLSLNANDIDGFDLNWSLDTDAGWINETGFNGLLFGIAEPGTYWANVSVNDGEGGIDSKNISIVIKEDHDRDGIMDEIDPDDDDDGWNDTIEVILGTDPFDDGVGPMDTDGDGTPNAWDTDDDDDGWGDAVEQAAGSDPLANASEPSDMDKDRIADVMDGDRDGDGVNNTQDAFPSDANEWLDSDKDGIGDNSDPYPDLDNDTTPADSGDDIQSKEDAARSSGLTTGVIAGLMIGLIAGIGVAQLFSMYTGKDGVLDATEPKNKPDRPEDIKDSDKDRALEKNSADPKEEPSGDPKHKEEPGRKKSPTVKKKNKKK